MKSIKYFLFEYNYSTKKNKSLEGFTENLAAQNALWATAYNYLEQKDGCEKLKDNNLFIIDSKKFRKSLKASLNPGHYIIRDPYNHFYRLEIWQKSIVPSNGWFGGVEEKWSKVLDLDIVEVTFDYEIDFNNMLLTVEKLREKCFTPISKSDLSQALKMNKELNKSLLSLESFKKIQDGCLSIKSLKENYPSEFANFQKKLRKRNILSESTILKNNDAEFFIEFPEEINNQNLD